MRKRKTSCGFIVTVITIVIAIFLVCSTFNDKEYTITITDKERIVETNNGEISSKYLVFGDGENGESFVFRNSDELLRGKFNSSNIQGALKEGKTYKVVVIGFRIPFLSCYENIISFEELKGSAK